jgi:hypothetical protein
LCCKSHPTIGIVLQDKNMPSASDPREFKRLLGFYRTQKQAKKLGHPAMGGVKPPDWKTASKGLVKIEATGRMEMNKSRH